VGTSIIQGARIAGARQIIAVDVLDSKLDTARRFGATHTVNASKVDPVKEIKQLSDGGVDYSFEAIRRHRRWRLPRRSGSPRRGRCLSLLKT